jgi:gas vesicle protein
MFFRKQKFPFGKVAIGFAVGAVTGAVLALLYAPFEGKKMKKKIAGVTENVIDKVEETVDDVRTAFRKVAKA